MFLLKIIIILKCRLGGLLSLVWVFLSVVGFQLRPVLEQPFHQPGPPKGRTKLSKSLLKIICFFITQTRGSVSFGLGFFSVVLQLKPVQNQPLHH